MTESVPSSSVRLNLAVTPIHYDLTYSRIDLVNFVFSGTCILHCTAHETSSILQLNALELQINGATLQCTGSVNNTLIEHNTVPENAVTFRYNVRKQTVDIAFDKGFEAGHNYAVTMDFSGCLNDKMCGLYRSVYINIHGETKIMATTQFEATDARRAFPCADEPALKATFNLTVVIPVYLQCLSNTPMAAIHTTAVNNGIEAIKTVSFQTTPKMSTYLLALVVGEFDGISQTSNGIVTTVYTVPGKANQAHFCLDTAVRCLDLYQELFHVPYPLTKSDLVAIPDFAAGAMEVM